MSAAGRERVVFIRIGQPNDIGLLRLEGTPAEIRSQILDLFEVDRAVAAGLTLDELATLASRSTPRMKVSEPEPLNEEARALMERVRAAESVLELSGIRFSHRELWPKVEKAAIARTRELVGEEVWAAKLAIARADLARAQAAHEGRPRGA